MSHLWFLTHADVQIDPAVPIEDWGLNDTGRTRHLTFAQTMEGVSAIHSSEERKARDGAAITGAVLGLVPTAHKDLHENDRSATGYLPEDEFRQVVTQFFSHPDRSIRGWEPAANAQARAVAALQRIVQAHGPDGDVMVIAHGGIGALVRAWAMGAAITPEHDQPSRSGGCYFRLSLPDWRLVQDWTVI
jgi:broad specificity phosphatase PhoE